MRVVHLGCVVVLCGSSAFGQGKLPASLSDKPAAPAAKPGMRYMLGSESLPQDGVPRGKLEGPTLWKSQAFPGTVRKYWVYVPTQYDAQAPACVLVFQDGARAVNPAGVLRVPTVLDNLINKKQIPVTIGIFITPGQKGDEFPETIGFGNPNNRSVEYDSLGDAYARLVVDEILPEVGKSYNLTKDPAGRAIGGFSSGAIAAFSVAWERPDQFRNVISCIGSFTNLRGGHVYPELVRTTPTKSLRVFVQEGMFDNRNAEDPQKDWYLQNEALVGALLGQNYDVAYILGKGGHSDDHGGAILPEALRWIWRDYPGVAKPATDPIIAAKAVLPIAEQKGRPKLP
jgi:enterochelin esterase family protein